MEAVAPEEKTDGPCNIFGEIAVELEHMNKQPPSYYPALKKRAAFDFDAEMERFRADCRCSRCWSDRFNAVRMGVEAVFSFDYFTESCRVCRVFRARLEEKELVSMVETGKPVSPYDSLVNKSPSTS